ncbi:cytochrome P450 [Fomes fomentarius]|nr:cytochrome P450 [Fomes fomentarius]
MEDPRAVFFTCAAVLVVVYIVRWRTSPLYKIPTVGGSSAPGLSYLAAFNFFRNGKALIEEGYQKYHNSAFKVATLDQWLVIVSGSKMVDELRRRPDEELSFTEGVEDIVQLKYTIGTETTEDPYHIDIIKEKLTRTLPAVLPEVIDELKVAVHQYIPANDDEWVTVNAVKTMQQIIARASNRAFVGLPVCRNQEFLDLAIAFTITVIKDRVIINLVPKPLKTLVGHLISSTNKSVARAYGYLKPVIAERKAKMAEHGDDWEDKPNDMLQWLLDEAASRKSADLGVTQRVLLINFAAIHTSSMSITQTLYDLGARPEYIKPLREEIEPILAAEGWTKTAMSKMWKLDSFLKESMRYNGISMTSITRKALKDITFHDGTFIPKGTTVLAAAHPTHYDETNYADASTFDGFRFARMREVEGEGMKHQYVNTSTEYVSFGHGKHACPGRFFAANELKAMLAYIVVNFDLKIPGDGERPQNIYYAQSVIPSPTGQVAFRKRQASV